MTESLFPGYEPVDTTGMGADAKTTAKQKAMIKAGTHPATLRPIPDTGGKTCGDCAHLWQKDRRWFKCDATPHAYDMRKWWPACDTYKEVTK